MSIIERYRKSIERERELKLEVHEIEKLNRELNEELMTTVGQEILKKRLLLEHEWVLGIGIGWKGNRDITLEADKLNPDLSNYIIDLDEQNVYWFLHDIPLQNSGWSLHMRRRGKDGMRLSHPLEKDIDVTKVMKRAFMVGVAEVRTGSLRSTYYKIRADADEYERVIKQTEGVFK